MKRKNRQALRAFVTALFLAVVLVLPGYPGMETIVRAASPESLDTADAAAEEEKQEINMETEADSAESPALAEEESPGEQDGPDSEEDTPHTASENAEEKPKDDTGPAAHPDTEPEEFMEENDYPEDDNPAEEVSETENGESSDPGETIPEAGADRENEEPVPEIPADLDFSSMRLIAAGADTDRAECIAVYENIALFQFASEEEARQAYIELRRTAVSVEPDITIGISEGQETASGTDMMDEENNPLAELNRAVEELPEENRERRIVALIDTGVNGPVFGEVCLTGEDRADHNGHGTDMARCMFEEDPEVRILSVKALRDDGSGDLSAVYAGIAYAVEAGAEVINLSLSAPRRTEHACLETMIKEAAEKGITVTAAAGNNGTDAADYIPGCVQEAVTVGACDENGTRRVISNYGAAVDYYVTADSTSEAAARYSALYASGRTPERVFEPSAVSEPGNKTDTGEEEDPAAPETETPQEAEKEERPAEPEPAAEDSSLYAADFRLRLQYHANGGTITGNADYSVGEDGYIKNAAGNTYLSSYPGLTSSDEIVQPVLVREFGLTRTGYHVNNNRAYNTRQDGSGYRINQTPGQNASSQNPSTPTRINNGTPISSNTTKTLYVEWIADYSTIQVTLKDDKSGQGIPGAEFVVGEYNAQTETYESLNESTVMTDLGNGSYELTVTYSDQNAGRFRIRQRTAPAGYINPDNSYRSVRIQANAQTITATTGGADLTWYDSRTSYSLKLDPNGGWNIDTGSKAAVTAVLAETGETQLQAGVRYTLANCDSGKNASFEYPNFTRDGYVFRGWNTAPDGSGTQYGTGAPAAVRDLVTTDGGKAVLHAQWSLREGVQQETVLPNGAVIRPAGWLEYSEILLLIPYTKEHQAVRIGECSDGFTLSGGTLLYNGPVSADGQSMAGKSASVILKERANDIYGNVYDVKITISDISYTMTDETVPEWIRLLSVNSSGVAAVQAYARKNGETTGFPVRMKVRISVLNPDGSEAAPMKTLMYFRDLDSADSTNGHIYKTGETGSGEISPYAEAVYFPLSTASVFYTDYPGSNSLFAAVKDGNTGFCGTENTEGTQAWGQIPEVPASYTAVQFEADSSSIEFYWSGENCGTSLFALARYWTIESKVVGDYPEGGTITLGGEGEVPYPHRIENVQYTVRPKFGYRIKAVRLSAWDPESGTWGDAVTLEVPENAEEYIRTFDPIITNYRIETEFEPVEVAVPAEARKEYNGHALYGEDFTFILEDEQGNRLGEAVNDKNGRIIFEPVSLFPGQHSGALDEETGTAVFHWFIREVPGNDRAVSYDEHVETVDIIVHYTRDHELAAEVTYDPDGAVFTNIYNPTVPTGVQTPGIGWAVLVLCLAGLFPVIRRIVIRRRR